MNSISSAQLGKAQTLFQQLLRAHALDFAGADPREARLRWAGSVVKHPISSFKELTRSEGHKLINALHRALGLPIGRSKGSRAAAEAGTEGRRNVDARAYTSLHVLASQQDFERIKNGIERLGWDEQHYQRWLRSPSSPLKWPYEVKTLAHANRVWWAIKKMLRKRGLWEN